MTFYCVIRISDLRLLYAGTDAQAAAAVTDDKSHCATGSTHGEAERAAAMAAGKLGQKTRPPVKPGPQWLGF